MSLTFRWGKPRIARDAREAIVRLDVHAHIAGTVGSARVVMGEREIPLPAGKVDVLTLSEGHVVNGLIVGRDPGDELWVLSIQDDLPGMRVHIPDRLTLKDGSPHWWACAEPERRPTEETLWHVSDCLGCSVKMDAWHRERA